ncbi:MAG: hypothetical protein U5K74_08035 [Gemmatimonadaceae bacterium]|nr:hypothetical protein [Gemmatimonadaceae bacterium]
MPTRISAALLGLAMMLSACSASETEPSGATGRGGAVAAQSAAARALQLPRMRPVASRTLVASDRSVVVRVRVQFRGSPSADTTVQARTFDAACGATFVDTAVVRNGNFVSDAVVWVEGPTAALITDGRTERRPTVQLDLCRLRPRVQVAAPGSTVMLVMRDSMAESLVIVPSAPQLPPDTIPFITYGQLVPVQHRADSLGMVAVVAARLPWARAFIAIAAPGTGALTDADGRAQFTLDGRGTTATIKAWHPSLGTASAKVTLSPMRADYDVTLTFKR